MHGGPRTSSLAERTDDAASCGAPNEGLATADAPDLGGTVGNNELEVESPPHELPSARDNSHTSITITLDTSALCSSSLIG